MRKRKYQWMKRITCAGILVLAMTFVFGLKVKENQVYGASGVALDATNFPDKEFRSAVTKKFDRNRDKFLSSKEIKNAKRFEIDEMGEGDTENRFERYVRTIKGIEYLTNLRYFYCSGQEIAIMDLSHNRKLTKVEVTKNQTKILNVSKNKELKELDCSYNLMTSLKVAGLKKLKKLYCDDDELTSLKVTGLKKLEVLSCEKNKLKSLNVNGLKKLRVLCFNRNRLKKFTAKRVPSLYEIECRRNKLKKLNVSACKNLSSLKCYQNRLTKLNVTKLKKLDYLSFGRNRLKRINVKKNNKLTELHCQNNRLTRLNVTKNKDLSTIDCSNNRLKTLDVSKNKDLVYFYCNGNRLTTLNLKNNKVIECVYCWNNKLVSGNLGLEQGKLYTTTAFQISPQKKTVVVKKSGKYYWAKLPQMSTTRKIKNLSSGTVGNKGIYWTSYKKIPKKVTYRLRLFTKGEAATKVTLILRKGKVKSGTLNKKKVILKKGKTAKLKVKLKPSSAINRKVRWTSSKKKIVKVSQKGTIRALRKGKAVITAKLSNGKKLRCKVTVQ